MIPWIAAGAVSPLVPAVILITSITAEAIETAIGGLPTGDRRLIADGKQNKGGDEWKHDGKN